MIPAERGEATFDINPHASIILGVRFRPSAARSAWADMNDDCRH
jgi:hypothetical protein